MLDMQIRKCIYTISHIHIITFQHHIRQIISPYFSYEPLEYGIDNEGTLNENVRIIFRNDGFVMQFNKETAILIFEGPISEVKKSNPLVEMFFDIYQKIKAIEGFVKTTTHSLATDFVAFTSKQEYDDSLVKNNFVNSPFSEVSEYASILELTRNGYTTRIQFGNYSEKDIIKSNLTPLKTAYNNELLGKYGFMAQVQVTEESNLPNFSKYKSLVGEAENIVKTYTNALCQ